MNDVQLRRWVVEIVLVARNPSAIVARYAGRAVIVEGWNALRGDIEAQLVNQEFVGVQRIVLVDPRTDVLWSQRVRIILIPRVLHVDRHPRHPKRRWLSRRAGP